MSEQAIGRRFGRGLAATPCLAALLWAQPVLAQTPPPWDAPTPSATAQSAGRTQTRGQKPPQPFASTPPTDLSAPAKVDLDELRRLDARGAPLRGPEPTALQDRNVSGAANYAAPVRKTRAGAYKPLPKRNARPLPPTVAYATAPRGRGRALPQPAGLDPAATVAAIPAPPQARRRVEEDPYAPTGINVGSLRLTPYSESSVGYDTNSPRSQAAPRASGFVREELGVGVQSLWNNHELKADLRGGYSEYFQDRASSRPDGAGKINARIDVTRDTTIDAEGRFNVDTQRPGSIELPSGGAKTVADRPWITSYGASLGAAQKYGRVTIGLRGSIDRTSYEDAKYSDGTTLALSQADYTAYELRGRVAYEAKPGLTPFAEVFADTRRHDSKIDSSGYARDSQGAGGRLGASFEITRTLTGEASVGYVNRKYEDARLADLRGPTFDASLVWRASPLTTVTARAKTTANETTVAGASGSLVRRGELEIGHALFRNFTITGIAVYQDTEYRGAAARERLYSAGLKAEYKLTREIALKASYSHDTLRSNVAGGGYKADVFMLGLRLQR